MSRKIYERKTLRGPTLSTRDLTEDLDGDPWEIIATAVLYQAARDYLDALIARDRYCIGMLRKWFDGEGERSYDYWTRSEVNRADVIVEELERQARDASKDERERKRAKARLLELIALYDNGWRG